MGAALMAIAAGLGPSAAAQSSPGEATYKTHCLVCHQTAGVGVRGQFPRLAGRVRAMAAEPRGRAVLIDAVMHGMTGEIRVDGLAIEGLMPPFRNLSDADLAGVLTYVSGLGAGGRKVAAFTPSEVRQARRQPPPSPGKVWAQRQAVFGGAQR